MPKEALDEISVLSAIYCEQDEFELLEESAETGLVYRINTLTERNNEKTPLSLIFHIPPDYPNNPPDISISSSHLSRKQCRDLRNSLLDTARSLPAEPMVHDLILWLQENFSDLINTAGCHSAEIRPELEDESWMALLLIDHMRSKAKYIKLIEKWTSELCLSGRLFMGKLILILLQGTKENIKEYIHLQRTVKVDVDSSGKRCKEKMMSVLCEIPSSEENILMTTFEVKDILSLDELKREFELVGLTELYNQYVSSLI
ncbi:RWD domain-containing protein 3 isoform X1 [Triplophysa dalaica]|uniref:RWD domain-containing protein 3 isoform X1 n=1 Tax=Triplophysa dalaica TaxID=1582913 RepID=UPI0024E013B6|nr:RWD domain-containing protein 3 isoform X1 [Triplophysa dalaica]